MPTASRSRLPDQGRPRHSKHGRWPAGSTAFYMVGGGVHLPPFRGERCLGGRLREVPAGQRVRPPVVEPVAPCTEPPVPVPPPYSLGLRRPRHRSGHACTHQPRRAHVAPPVAARRSRAFREASSAPWRCSGPSPAPHRIPFPAWGSDISPGRRYPGRPHKLVRSLSSQRAQECSPVIALWTAPAAPRRDACKSPWPSLRDTTTPASQRSRRLSNREWAAAVSPIDCVLERRAWSAAPSSVPTRVSDEGAGAWLRRHPSQRVATSGS